MSEKRSESKAILNQKKKIDSERGDLRNHGQRKGNRV